MPDPICLRCISDRIIQHGESCPDFEGFYILNLEGDPVRTAQAMLGKRWREETGG